MLLFWPPPLLLLLVVVVAAAVTSVAEMCAAPAEALRLFGVLASGTKHQEDATLTALAALGLPRGASATRLRRAAAPYAALTSAEFGIFRLALERQALSDAGLLLLQQLAGGYELWPPETRGCLVAFLDEQVWTLPARSPSGDAVQAAWRAFRAALEAIVKLRVQAVSETLRRISRRAKRRMLRLVLKVHRTVKAAEKKETALSAPLALLRSLATRGVLSDRALVLVSLASPRPHSHSHHAPTLATAEPEPEDQHGLALVPYRGPPHGQELATASLPGHLRKGDAPLESQARLEPIQHQQETGEPLPPAHAPAPSDLGATLTGLVSQGTTAAVNAVTGLFSAVKGWWVG